MKIRDSLASWTHTEEVNAALLTFLSDKAVKAKREQRKELRIRTNSAGLRARRPSGTFARLFGLSNPTLPSFHSKRKLFDIFAIRDQVVSSVCKEVD
jgi:hypothetical protein